MLRIKGKISLLGGMMLLFLGGAARADDGPGATSTRPTILAHVMPWYEAGPAETAWGWHWTMNHFDPNRVDATGRRAIASHLYPAIGPYDSLSPAVLEYQALTMKVAGVDGAIIDWYGTDAVNDYPGIHRRTLALIAALKQHGLKFAICYEDRAVKAVADRDKLPPDRALARAEAHLKFCQDRWFRDPAYVAWGGKPLLMVFGPDYIQPPQWAALLDRLDPAPAFFTLHEPRGPAVGSFAWPPMWASRDGKLTPEALDAYLDRFARQPGAKIPCAFPGFRDIYAEAKTQPSYGLLDDRAGATFRHTFARAEQLHSPIIQVATWNDYGEGTVVEPTREHATRDLQVIQEARRRWDGGSFSFSPADLQLPGEIHALRTATPDPASPARRQHLDAAARSLDAGDPKGARRQVERARPAPLDRR